MIADDTNAIRDAMRRHAQAKVQAQAEADRRAAEPAPTVNLPHPTPLFSESAAPFRGFFVSEDGDIVPLGDTPSEASWADWIDTQEGNIVHPVAADPIQFTFIVNDCPTEPQSAAIERLAAEYRRSGIDPWGGKDATVQAANSASNRFTFWGYRGEDPDGE